MASSALNRGTGDSGRGRIQRTSALVAHSAGCRPRKSGTGEASRSAPPVFRLIGEVARPPVVAGRLFVLSLLLLESGEPVLQCRGAWRFLRGLLPWRQIGFRILEQSDVTGNVAGVNEGRDAIRLPEPVMVCRDLDDEVARVGLRGVRFRDFEFGPLVGIPCVDTLDMVEAV